MKRFMLWAAATLGTLAAQEFKVGGKIADFNVQDLNGKSVAYSQLKGDVTVVTFVSTKCPISNDYNERMKQVFADYKARVKFVFLNSNANEPAAEVEAHAKEVGFAFPVYKDASNTVADRFGATVTPESYVIDKTGTIVYHGYIDDARNPARVTTQGLRKAMDAALTGQAIGQAETKAFGCTIKRVRKSS